MTKRNTSAALSSTSQRALEGLPVPAAVPARSTETTTKVPEVHTTTKLDSGEVGQYYQTCAVACANNAMRMIMAGSVIYFMSRLFSQAQKKPDFGTVDNALNARLTTSHPDKGMSTLKNWITLSRRLYVKLTNDEKLFAGIVNDVRTAPTPVAAVDAINKYLSTQRRTGSDGKEYAANASLDLLDGWVMENVTQRNVKVRTVTERVSSAAKSATNVLAKVMTEHKAPSIDIAKAAVENMTTTAKVIPLDLAQAAIARIGSNIIALEATITQSFSRLLMDNKFEEAQSIIDKLIQRLADQRKNAAQNAGAGTVTATPENTAAAEKANTAQVSDTTSAATEKKPAAPSKKSRAA